MEALIDGDELLYTIGFTVKEDGTVGEALSRTNKKIESICAAIGSEAYRVFLTGKQNFRMAVGSRQGYKANRKDKPKPTYYDEIKAHLVQRHNAFTAEYWEADDCLSLYYSANPTTSIICTQDKDLRQIVGPYCNPYKQYKEEDPETGNMRTKRHIVFGEMTEHEARLCLAEQIWRGDTTDNIPSLFKWSGKKMWRGAYKDLAVKDNPLAYACEVFQDYMRQKEFTDYELEWAMWEQLTLLTMLTKPEEHHTIITKVNDRNLEALRWTQQAQSTTKLLR